MPQLTRTTRARPRAGFTLTELLVSLVMFGLVSGIILGLVRSQQRFYRGATEIIDVRSQLRQAAAVLPLDLRSVSTVSKTAPLGSPYQPSVVGSDIRVMNDKEIFFRATIGSGVICQVDAATNTIYLAPVTLARGNVLTSWFSDPAGGDTVFIFDRGINDGATDDQWRPYVIANVDLTSTTGCGGSKLLTPGTLATGDDDKPKPKLTLTPIAGSSALALATYIDAGAVVRLTRSVAYGLYRSDADTHWYLGYRSAAVTGGVAGALGAWEPVAGPFSDYSPGGATNGVAFVYYDSLKAVTTDPNAVARVDVMLRGSGREVGNVASNTSYRNRKTFADSLLLSIAIRNRS